MTRIIIYISIFFASVFCFVRANAQTPLGSYSTTATNEIKGSLQVNKSVYLPQFADPTGDSVLTVGPDSVLRNKKVASETDTVDVAVSQYQLDTAKDNIRTEIGGIGLSDVTQNDSTTDQLITARGLVINGFGSAPGFGAGWGLQVARNYYYDGVTGFDTLKANARSIQERSIISTTADYAVFDYLTSSYGEIETHNDHFTVSQYRTVVDYLPGSTLTDYHSIYSQLTPKRINLTNAIDIEIEPLGSASMPATTTNHIGIRIKDFTTGTNNFAANNWGVLVEGSRMGNYFGGGLKIAGAQSFSSYGADFDTTLIVRDTATFNNKVVLNSVGGGTEDSALALNGSNEVIKVPISTTTPTLNQVLTSGATSTLPLTTGKWTSVVTADNTAPDVIDVSNNGVGASTGTRIKHGFGQRIEGTFLLNGTTFYDKNATDKVYVASNALTFDKSTTISTSLSNGRLTLNSENGASADVYIKSANGLRVNTFSGSFADRFIVSNTGSIYSANIPTVTTYDSVCVINDGILNKILFKVSASATLDFPSTATNDNSDLTIAVSGAVVGDPVSIGHSLTTQGTFEGTVSAANTVTIRFHNTAAGAFDPPSGTFKVYVWK